VFTKRGFSKLILFGLFALATPVLFGQGETTGAISGIVLDASGGAIPGARVSLTNTGTGAILNQDTDAGGHYNFPALQLGTYTLTVEAAGFRKYVRENITVHVNDRLRIDPAMEIGQLTESVTVSGIATQVETEKPALSGLVDSQQVRDLPLPNRNFMGLTMMVPGVTYTGGREISLGGLSSNPMFINGSRQTANNWMVDGSRNTDTGSNGTLFNYPSIDAIEEFRILTNSFDAQFGRNSGGVINVVVKSGTRDFHGDAYEFVRNDKFNARDAFQFTRPIPDRDSLKGPYRYNNFGYTIGGPFFIPKVYPKQKSRTFFFWSQEWRRIRQYSVLSTSTVPSPAMLNGIFPTAIKDPEGGYFPDNTIPANRVDGNAKALIQMGFWPAANLPNNQYRWVGSSPTNFRQELIRADQEVNEKWRLMVRYIHDQFYQLNPTGIWGGSPLPDLYSNNTNTPATNIVARSINIVNPRMLNEFQFDYAANAISSDMASERGFLSNVPGFKVNPFYPDGPQHNALGLLPTISVSGLTGSGPDVFPFFNENPSFTFQDNFTWTRGPHEFKFGILFSTEKKSENAGGPFTNGSFSFNGSRTGVGFGDFLLGLPSSYTEDQTDVRVNVAYKTFEWYAQDNWKITPRLTLNLGVRWSFYGNPTDDNDILVSFLPSRYSIADAVRLNPNGSLATDATGKVIGDRYNGLIFPTGVLAGHDSPWGRKVQSDRYNAWGPRIGIAWDPSGRGLWSFRAGYGIYYDRTLVGIIEQNGFSDPLANARVTVDNTQFQNPQANVPRNAVLPLGITSVGSPWVVPMTQQWNLSIQRQLGEGTVIQAAYAGSGGNHLLRDVLINQPLPHAADTVGGALNLVRPYQGYAGITNREPRATSRYNALQLMLRRSVSSRMGVTANLAYTYSKVMTDASADRGNAPMNSYDLKQERGPATYDRTQVFTPTVIWQVPYNKNWSPAVRQTLGGWEIAGMMSFWTGTPFTVTQSGDPLYTGTTHRPNVIAKPTIHNSIATRSCYIYKSTNPACAGLSGADAFQLITSASPTFGNAGINILRGPGVQNFDFAVYKNFPIMENGPRLQFRAEMFNAINHIQLNNPGANYSLASFGTITGNRGPRLVQFGLKLSY